MGKKKNSLAIIYPEGQKYACRDCPARCCTSWGIPVSEEERERILSDEEACTRLDDRSLAILRAGVLPMREKNEQLTCVFLDDDLLCSLHRKHGHEFLPATCQAYPFGFSMNEKQQPVVLASRYCPSIRDNRGEPIEALLAEKFDLVGGAPLMSEKMGLRSGRVLPLNQYVMLIEEWATTLQKSSNVALSLASLFDLTDALDQSLPPTKKPTDKEIRVLLANLEVTETTALVRGKLTFGGRMLVAHLLGGICYPSRVMLAHRTTPIRFWEKVGSWGNRLRWLFNWGQVKLHLVERTVHVAQISRVAPFVDGPMGRLIVDYLVELIARRQGMAKQGYLHRVLVDYALMTLMISRYARASASAEGLSEVAEKHVREGIGIAELLFTHQGDLSHGLVLQQLRLLLMGNRDDFRGLLAAES